MSCLSGIDDIDGLLQSMIPEELPFAAKIISKLHRFSTINTQFICSLAHPSADKAGGVKVRDEYDDAPRPGRSALRAAASVAALEEDPRYSGKVVKVSTVSKRRSGLDSDGDDSDDDGGVASEDDEEIDDDEVDGLGSDEESDDDEEGDFSGDDTDDDDDEVPEELGVSQISRLAPRPASKAGRGSAARAEEDDSDDAAPTRARSRGAAGSFLNDIDAELAALEHADAAAVTMRSRRDDDDATKGRAAKDASSLYEAGLEARIRLQGVMASAARVPPAEALDSLCESSSELREEAAGARAELTGLLTDLLRLRAATLSNLPDVVTAATAGAGKKRRRASDGEDDATAAQRAMLPAGVSPLKRRRSDSDDEGDSDSDSTVIAPDSDALWASMQAGWDAMTPWRNDSLEKWGRRLAYASGLSAKAALKLKVLTTSVPAQVAQAMASDRARLVERCRPSASSIRVLGLEKPQAQAQGSGSEERFAEAYDDGDFYASLLKEFVSSSSSGTGAASALAGVGSGALLGKGYARKVREGIDRRATKGRRLKFTVQPKLVAFMAPAPYVVPPELAFDIDTLVASLFRS